MPSDLRLGQPRLLLRRSGSGSEQRCFQPVASELPSGATQMWEHSSETCMESAKTFECHWGAPYVTWGLMTPVQAKVLGHRGRWHSPGKGNVTVVGHQSWGQLGSASRAAADLPMKRKSLVKWSWWGACTKASRGDAGTSPSQGPPDHIDLASTGVFCSLIQFMTRCDLTVHPTLSSFLGTEPGRPVPSLLCRVAHAGKLVMGAEPQGSWG